MSLTQGLVAELSLLLLARAEPPSAPAGASNEKAAQAGSTGTTQAAGAKATLPAAKATTGPASTTTERAVAAPARPPAPNVGAQTNSGVETRPASAKATAPSGSKAAPAAATAKATAQKPDARDDEKPAPTPIPESVADGEQPEVIAIGDLGIDPSEDAAPATPKAPSRPWPSPKGPAPASGGTGTLSLVALPRASVTMNGIPLGSTPLNGRELPSGRHRLILIGSDDIPRVLILDITDGADVELNLLLTRLWPEALRPNP